MTGRTHDLAAFTLLTYLATKNGLPIVTLGTAITAVTVNLIGGITPDIDEPTAPFWRNLPVGGFFGRIFDALIGGHRFWLHSLVGMAVMGLGLRWLLAFLHPSWPSLNGTVVWWAFMIGYFSHLLMDSFTKEGVPWLLPIPIKLGFPPDKGWRITTGKFVEMAIIFPGILAVEIYLLVSHYGQLWNWIHHLVR